MPKKTGMGLQTQRFHYNLEYEMALRNFFGQTYSGTASSAANLTFLKEVRLTLTTVCLIS
jgi:hypothetical protein